jgi:hypothetical protein
MDNNNKGTENTTLSPKVFRQLEVVCGDIDINHGNLNYCNKMRTSRGSYHPVCVTTNACFYGDHLFACIYVCNSLKYYQLVDFHKNAKTNYSPTLIQDQLR